MPILTKLWALGQICQSAIPLFWELSYGREKRAEVPTVPTQARSANAKARCTAAPAEVATSDNTGCAAQSISTLKATGTRAEAAPSAPD